MEPGPNVISEAEVYARIDALADQGKSLSRVNPDKLADFYAAIDLQAIYEHEARLAEVTIHPMNRVNSVRVRGASCTLTTRLNLPLDRLTPGNR
jgi:hypothetical protein